MIVHLGWDRQLGRVHACVPYRIPWDSLRSHIVHLGWDDMDRLDICTCMCAL